MKRHDREGRRQPGRTPFVGHALCAVWLAYALVYAALYFHTYVAHMFRYFLRLPEKAPALWRWLDSLF